MKDAPSSDRLRSAVDQVNETARQIRRSSSQLLSRTNGNSKEAGDGDGGAHRTAQALAHLSDSLERAGQAAMNSGLAMRDRSRDTARAISRSERVLREQGLRGAAARAATHPGRGRFLTVVGTVVGAAVAGVVLLMGCRDRENS
ncbi:MAG: hypothetical protein EA422_12080 [Gemmatimonadales bacterium]|nr:MAG: hypothetical protein EA422_12080 [Gemmatimonadales bacterium]